MSAYFVILYAGSPIRLSDKQLVNESQASHFCDESSAWIAAKLAGLNISHCQVKCIS